MKSLKFLLSIVATLALSFGTSADELKESKAEKNEKLILCNTGKNRGKIVTFSECEKLSVANATKKWFLGFTCGELDRLSFLDDIDLEVNLGTGIDIGPVGFSFDYNYGVRPTNIQNEYVRLDKWETSLQLSLLRAFGVDTTSSKENGDATFFDAGLRGTRRFVFGQTFDSPDQARCLRNTYLPSDYPNSAEKLAEMNINDYARFDIETVTFLNAGASTFLDSLGVAEARAQWSRFSFNTLQVHIDKISDSLVRMRFVTTSPIKRKVRFSVGVNKRYEIGISRNIDRQLIRLSKLRDYAEFEWNYKEDGETLLSDFTMDLSDPKMVELYDQVFKKGQKRLRDRLLEIFKSPMKGAKEVAKLFNKEAMQTLHFTNIAALEQEAIRQLAQVPEAGRTLIKNLEADNKFTGSSLRVRAGIELFNLGFLGRYRLNEISLREIDLDMLSEEELIEEGIDPDTINEEGFAQLQDLQTKQNFIMPVWIKEVDALWWGGERGSRRSQRVTVLFKADENYVPTGFESISLFSDKLDVDYEVEEQKEDLRRLQNVLPESSFNDMLGGLVNEGWDLTSKLEDVRLILDYSYNNNAYLALARAGFASSGMDIKESKNYIKETFMDYMVDLVAKEHVEVKVFRQRRGSVINWVDVKVTPDNANRLLRAKINRVAKRIAIAFNPMMDGKKRLKQFIKLRRNRFFVKYGARYLAQQIKDIVNAKTANIEDIIFFNANFTQRRGGGYAHSFGNPENSELISAIEFIQQITSNESTEIIEIRDYAKRIKMNGVLAKMTKPDAAPAAQ